jgi:hypothetical protein
MSVTHDPADTKTCDHCGNTFDRPPGTPPSRWDPRRYCGRTCASAGTRPPGRPTVETKTCKHCGVTFERGRDDHKRWAGRQFCCREHGNTYRRGKTATPRPKARKVAEQPAPKPAAAPRPVWRPASFSPQPNIRRTA